MTIPEMNDLILEEDGDETIGTAIRGGDEDDHEGCTGEKTVGATILGVDRKKTDVSGTIISTPLDLHQHANSVPKLPPVNSSICTSSISHTLAGDDFIVCEILSRLRVKSLIRFKCVCKSWKSLIEKDPYFIGLHFTRSKAAGASILVEILTSKNCARVLLAELLLPSEDGQEGGATFEREIPVYQHKLDGDGLEMLNFVNGLICFLNRNQHSVRVYNPSTGESTPWIRSTIRKEDALSYLNFGHYEFGYDPSTMEHKVLCMWDMDLSRTTCEVLTVGKHLNQWRRIEDAPPVSPVKLGCAVHTTGSMYWCSDIYNNGVRHIVEFNVRSERFNVISLPNFIIADVTKPYMANIMEVGGRLAVLALKITRGDYLNDTLIENNSSSVKMCVMYHSHDDNNQYGTSIAGSSSSNYRWMEESFSTPPFDWKLSWFDNMYPIKGTDLSIMQYPADGDFSFYYYDWKRKSFSSKKCVINGISYDGSVEGLFYFYTFTESLFPVN